MYTVVGRLYKNDKLFGYTLEDLSSGRYVQKSIVEVVILCLQGYLSNVECSFVNANLLADDTYFCEELPKSIICDSSLSMFFIKNKLDTLVSRVQDYNKRFCFTKLEEYLLNPPEKVCIIFGLMRTGKTTMMLQAINFVGTKNCAFISLNDSDTSEDLFSMINTCYDLGIRYVFIDEISNLSNILSVAQTLQDKYVALGMHIVISGTDSYVLSLSSNSNLLARCIVISTSYISYKEYVHIFGYAELDEYLKRGSILDRSFTQDSFCWSKFSDRSISENIERSILKSDRSKFGALYDIAEDSGSIKNCIECLVERANQEFTSKILLSGFKNAHYSIVKNSIKHNLEDSSNIDTAKYSDLGEILKFKVKELLGIHLSNINTYTADINDIFNSLLQILRIINAVRDVKSIKDTVDGAVSTIFTIPGLSFYHTTATIYSLMKSEVVKNNFSKPEIIELTNKLIECCLGDTLEGVVFLYAQELYGSDFVYKYRDIKSNEIDCVIECEDYFIVVEVKHSEQKVEEQKWHLKNEEVISKIESYLGKPVKNKVVLYMGETDLEMPDDCVWYVNIQDFLLDMVSLTSL